MSAASIRDARPGDLPVVLMLLREARLPEDVEPHFATFLIAEREGGIVGVVGLEGLGLHRLPREEAPVEVRATKELSELCPSAATLMALRK